MNRRYRLISLRYCSCAHCGQGSLPTESTVIGEFTDREELEKEIAKKAWKGEFLLLDFLINDVWYRGQLNSRDPIAWD